MRRDLIRQRTASLSLVIALILGSAGGALAQEHDGAGSDRVLQADELPEVGDPPESLRVWLLSLRPDERRGAVSRLRQMPVPRRRAFFRRWNSMSEEQRIDLQERLEHRPDHRTGARKRVDRMTPAERRRFRAKASRWEDMKPRERAKMRRRLERFSRLSESEQEALVERSFPDAGPEERAQKLRELRAATANR
jgi:hypothetical protein